MVRRKEFNSEDVLEKAMEVFWRRGYEATSIQDLVECMGVNRGSLYNAFGDKRGLFKAVISFYGSKIVREAIACLEAPGASKQAILDYFRQLAADEATDCRGCLLVNSAVELGIRDPELRCQLATNLQRIEDAFFKALTRAQDKGEVSFEADTRALARYFTCLMQGLSVTSKLRPDPVVLQSIVMVALASLEIPQAPVLARS